MSKKRILRILNRFNLGGPTYNASLLTRYLSDDYETLLIGGPNEKNEHDSLHIPHSLGIEPVIIESMTRSLNVLRDRQAYQEIKRIISDFQPDIVHTHASKAGALGRRAAHQLKVPLIVHTYHGHVFDAYFNGMVSSFYKGIERRLARKTHAIIALSERQRDDLVRRHRICRAEQVQIIPNGFDLSRFAVDMESKRQQFRAKHQLSEHHFAIGIIGRMVPVKNHKLFADMLALILQQGQRPMKAFVVGDGETRPELEQRLQQHKISYSDGADPEATVQFLSWQTHVDEIIAGLDLVALTSLNEGTPVCLIEAQAANCPVVSTDVGGIRDIVMEGKTALLAPSDDATGLAQHALQLMHDDQLHQAMTVEGRDFVMERFHFMRMVQDMNEMYRQFFSRMASSNS